MSQRVGGCRPVDGDLFCFCVHTFGSDLFLVAAYINRRCGDPKFMFNVVEHIVESYLLHRQLVNVKEQAEASELAHHDKAKPLCALRHAHVQRARRVEPSSSCHCFEACATRGPTNNIDECFLSSLRVEQESADYGQGVTWLELYRLYRLEGGSKPIVHLRRCLHAKATADKQQAAFRQMTRGLVDRVIEAESKIHLCKPLESKNDKIARVGILGDFPKSTRHRGEPRRRGALGIAMRFSD